MGTHHKDTRYVKTAAIIRQAATSNPGAVCWRCGLTLDAHQTRTGRPDRWQAGHTIPGSNTWRAWLNVATTPPPGDWLAPEARSCNAADGARRRNALSASLFDW